MEKNLNTLSDSEARDLVNNSGSFSLTIGFQKEEEMIDGNLTKLNEVSISKVEILESPKRKNGISGIENELIVTHNKNVSMSVDLDGSLNISDFTPEKYSINDMGELIIQL